MRKILIALPTIAHYRKDLVIEIDKIADKENYEIEYVSYLDYSSTIQELEIENLDKSKFYKFSIYKIFNKFTFCLPLIKKIFYGDYNTVLLVPNIFDLTGWLISILKSLGIIKDQIIIWTHGILCDKRKINSYSKILLYYPFNGMIVYNERAKENLRKYFFNKNISVCYNSNGYLDNQDLKKNTQENRYWLYVGRLVKSKKIEELIIAYHHLCQMNNDISYTLRIIGDGPQREYLEDLTKSLDIQDKVIFLGAIYNKSILKKEFSNCIATISPGNVGLLAITSFKYSTPVITHSNLCKQMPEVEIITENVNGLFYREGDYKDLSKALLKSKDFDFDFESMKEELVKRYNPENQANIIMDSLIY